MVRILIVLALLIGLGASPAGGDEPPYTDAYAGGCGGGTSFAEADVSTGLLLARASIDSADREAEHSCAQSWIELRRDDLIPGATYRVEAHLEFRDDEWKPQVEVAPFPQAQLPGAGAHAWISAFMIPFAQSCDEAGDCSGGGPEIRENVVCAPVLWCLDRLHGPQLEPPAELTLSAEVQMKEEGSPLLQVLVWITAGTEHDVQSNLSAAASAGVTVREIRVVRTS